MNGLADMMRGPRGQPGNPPFPGIIRGPGPVDWWGPGGKGNVINNGGGGGGPGASAPPPVVQQPMMPGMPPWIQPGQPFSGSYVSNGNPFYTAPPETGGGGGGGGPGKGNEGPGMKGGRGDITQWLASLSDEDLQNLSRRGLMAPMPGMMR